MILSVLAHHKTDAIFRVFNTDRYNDRDVIITNLLDSYDRLIAFGEKHLNDLFTMDGIVSVSARDKQVFRDLEVYGGGCVVGFGCFRDGGGIGFLWLFP